MADGRPILYAHGSPNALGGSERALFLASAELRRRGQRVILVHGESELRPDLAAAADLNLALPTLFRRPTAATARRRRAELRLLRNLVREHDIRLAHAHFWGHWVLLQALRRVLPTVATTSVAVCPNGARYRYETEQHCERRAGASCLTWGHRTQGCGQTADEVPFGPAAMVVAIAETKCELRELRKLNRVIVPSDWQFDRLVADGVSRETTTVVVPPVVADPRQTPLRGVPRIAVACRLVRAKGVHRLLDASARLTAEHEVDVVGDGPARAALEAQARALGLAGRVRFHGRLDPAESASIVSRASVCVVPSLLPETFGMSGAEASASGVPVVAYDGSGIRDWIARDGVDVPIRELTLDALVRGLQDALAIAAGGAPRSRERHGLSSHVDHLERVYAEVLAETVAHAPLSRAH